MQALKKFVAVRKHFEDFQEDQFDFHGYCARKMTLRSYIQMLQMQDRLYHNIAFSKVGTPSLLWTTGPSRPAVAWQGGIK